jgi:hypothetical protein
MKYENLFIEHYHLEVMKDCLMKSVMPINISIIRIKLKIMRSKKKGDIQ